MVGLLAVVTVNAQDLGADKLNSLYVVYNYDKSMNDSFAMQLTPGDDGTFALLVPLGTDGFAGEVYFYFAESWADGKASGQTFGAKSKNLELQFEGISFADFVTYDLHKNNDLFMTKGGYYKISVNPSTMKMEIARMSIFVSPKNMYIYGKVNGKMYEQPDEVCALKETKTPGVYTWEGNSLGSGIKIYNGEWTDERYIFGAPEQHEEFEKGRVYDLYCGQGALPILFDGLAWVLDAKVTFDFNHRTMTIEGEFPTYYLIGSNVNGIQNVTDCIPEGAFTKKKDNFYTWQGEQMGAYFKVIASDMPTFAAGSNGSALTLYAPYNYHTTWDGRDKADLITVDGAFTIFKPVLSLDQAENIMELGGFLFPPQETGVEGIEEDADADAPIYNLQGIKVDRPRKGGIYIVRGKKIIF